MSKNDTMYLVMIVAESAETFFSNLSDAGEFLFEKLQNAIENEIPPEARSRWPTKLEIYVLDQTGASFIVNAALLVSFQNSIFYLAAMILCIARVYRKFSKQVKKLILMLVRQKKLSHFFCIWRAMSSENPEVLTTSTLRTTRLTLQITPHTDLGKIFMLRAKRFQAELKTHKQSFVWGTAVPFWYSFHFFGFPHRNCWEQSVRLG